MVLPKTDTRTGAPALQGGNGGVSKEKTGRQTSQGSRYSTHTRIPWVFGRWTNEPNA